MGRIRILSDEIANQIAAGEVVERPASVVKELVENSLDAGADSIRVDVEAGGRRLIRVTDNGAGMIRDDALLAFERHATSKLETTRDLLSIATLGFRGEALPSIASVSRLLLETRTAAEAVGTAVEIAGGRMLRCDDTALASGTTITVKDLFYNVPARRKFLRSEQTELAHIASLVTHYSLAHPARNFELTSAGRELLKVSVAADLRSRVYQVFGSGILTELIELGETAAELVVQPPAPPPWRRTEEDDDRPEPLRKRYALRGFISAPHIQKSNRNSIYLFVNGRLIKDRLLLHALSSAYHNVIPANAFPFALLFLECDYDEVDVNVHPSKTEVRFRHQTFVHDFVRDALAAALTRSRPVSELPRRPPPDPGPPAIEPQPGAGLPYSEFTQRLENQDAGAPPSAVLPPDGAASADPPEFVLQSRSSPPPRLDFGGTGIAVPGSPPVPPGRPSGRLPVPDTHRAFPAGVAEEPAASLSVLAELRPLGQIHNSFIIAAGADGLWIIDQHVAHERILFEKVLRQRASGTVEKQALLLPLVLEISPAQRVQYSRIEAELHAAGFEAEPFGPRSIAVKCAPAGVPAPEVEKMIFEILEIADSELRDFSLEDLERAVCATIACRAAIKINTPLEPAKMEWLLRTLAATENPMTCPHGRPIALRYSTRDILKSFHRI